MSEQASLFDDRDGRFIRAARSVDFTSGKITAQEAKRLQADVDAAREKYQARMREYPDDATRERDRAARVAELRTKMQELAHEMLVLDAIAHGPGVAFYEVRHAVETRGLTHEDDYHDRTLSFGSGLMRQAGSVATGTFVISKHKNAKGRRVSLFKLHVPDIAVQTEADRDTK